MVFGTSQCSQVGRQAGRQAVVGALVNNSADQSWPKRRGIYGFTAGFKKSPDTWVFLRQYSA